MLGESSGQVCVITRCNYTLFNEAVSVCCAQNNTKVGFVGVRNSLNHQSRGFLFSCWKIAKTTESMNLLIVVVVVFFSVLGLKKSRVG